MIHICKLQFATKLVPTVSYPFPKNTDSSKAVNARAFFFSFCYNVNTTFLKPLCRLCFCRYLDVMVMLALEYSSSVTASGANKCTLESGGQTDFFFF